MARNFFLTLVAFVVLTGQGVGAVEKPNIILIFADDISARELPIYGSSVWSKPEGGDTTDPALRASTPVLDRLAQEGCWVKTAWAAVVCSPSRAMMMTGRYAHRHKWWNNKDKGTYLDSNGRRVVWPLYESSPLQIGHVAQQGGYATFWSGKTQMAGDLSRFGFDEGCFTPGSLSDTDNPYTDFKLVDKKVNGNKILINADSGEPVDTYKQHGWYWFPHVRLMHHPSAQNEFEWWPNTPQSQEQFGLNTYGPDVELGIESNTIIIFCTDNGTSGYEVNGKSLVPFLFSDQTTHRDWIYGYRGGEQIIRGFKVMKDGRGKWWDVESDPDDLISFTQINNWQKMSATHRAERDLLAKILPRFDLQDTQHDAPNEPRR